jgi:hypothetical protein
MIRRQQSGQSGTYNGLVSSEEYSDQFDEEECDDGNFGKCVSQEVSTGR